MNVLSSFAEWCSYIDIIAKTTSNKAGALIGSIKYLTTEVALYFYKSTFERCLEYCRHCWAGTRIYCLNMLDI